MITCSHCQQANRPGAFYCKQCGRALICPRCRVVLHEPANYCDNCGQALAHESAFFALPTTSVEAKPVPPGEAIVEDLTAGKAVAESVPPPAASSSLVEQFIPRALRAKLESARAADDRAGERRVVTMLFCDVKGSTAAAERLDPEEWTEIVNGAFEYMIQPVFSYEGTVARLLGDGILALFGAPIAHEDDPQRAILAGLDIVIGIDAYREEVKRGHGLDFDVRVGINTGLVVTGAIGSDQHLEYSALGDAINVAARMEQAAAPGSVQIAHDTYKLVKPLFDVEELGGIEVKGKAEPVRAYRVLRRKTGVARQRGLEGQRSPLVGRDQELAALQEVVNGTRQGLGRIVCVVGEAGLGKSRLLEEIRAYWERADIPGRWVSVNSFSYESCRAYGLFQRLIRRLNGIAPGDTADIFREKLQPLLEQFPAERRSRAGQVFETLFALENSPGTTPLEGETFRRELFDVVALSWRQHFADRPVVLVLDDLHWSDAASIDLLKHLFSVTETAPLVLLCAFRPDRETLAWTLKNTADEQYGHRYMEITLRPLTREQTNEIVNNLLTIADLPRPLRERILERAGGNPFFVEEVVRSLIHSGAVVPEERSENGSIRLYWRATADGTSLEIPDNLQSLLTARIDQLEEDTRRVLQLASVIGRTFYERVLAQLTLATEESGGDVEGQLRRLLQLQILQEAARLPEIEYMFRNPLTQEVVYRGILLKRRREYHCRVGEVLEQLFADRLEEQAPALARHFQEAQDSNRAVRYYTMAGDAAFRLYALTEAIEHYEQALTLCDRAAADSELLIHLYGRRGRALELVEAYEDALENYVEMERLAGERNDERLRLAALSARTVIHSTLTPLFDPEVGLPLTEEAISLARQQGDHAAEAKALWSLMLVQAFALGDFAAGVRSGQESLALARQHELSEQLPYILNDLGRTMGFHGQAGEGLPLIAKARPLFEKAGNLPLLQDSLSAYASVAHFAGKFSAALEAAEEGLRVSRSINNHWGININSWHVGTLRGELGELGPAVVTIEGTVNEASVNELFLFMPFLGLIYSELGTIGPILGRCETLADRVETTPVLNRDQFLGGLIRLYVLEGNLTAAESAAQRVKVDVERDALLPMNTLAFLAKVEMAFARGQNVQALALLDRVIAQQESRGIGILHGDTLLLQARALLAMNPPQPEQAQAVLEKACGWARQSSNKRVLWKLLFALSDLVDEEQATRLRAEARDIVTWISNGVEDADLRASFLSQEPVRSLLGDG